VTESKIKKRVWIQASTEIVFQALTRANALEEWFCDKATADARDGGEVTAQWNDGKSRRKGRAVITRFVPGSALELHWTDDGSGEGSAHTLCYDIHPKSSGATELVMVDSDGGEADEGMLAYLDEGWNAVLTELRDYCEHKERAAKKHRRP
jgi:uncharacterized protein YndB with AHSA1/START domain